MTLTTMIAALEEALKAATPGPWGTAGRTMVCSLNDAPYPELLADASQCINDEANARLIALMRNSLPTLIEVARQKEELMQVFEAQWGAEMRAKQRWQIETGKEGTWPDRANLVVWLMERVEKMEASLKRQGKALGEIIKLDDPYANWSEEMANIARAALTAHKEKSDV